MSDEKIFTGSDKALEMGFPNFETMLRQIGLKKGFVFTGKVSKDTVQARIDFGRWLADCDCGGAGYVDPDHPIFACASCGNRTHAGDFLTVVFPGNAQAIEAELMLRPVKLRPALKPVEAAMNAILVVPGLARQWDPGESVSELKKQRTAALKKLKDRRVK
jgi:hypothetical protein